MHRSSEEQRETRIVFVHIHAARVKIFAARKCRAKYREGVLPTFVMVLNSFMDVRCWSSHHYAGMILLHQVSCNDHSTLQSLWIVCGKP